MDWHSWVDTNRSFYAGRQVKAHNEHTDLASVQLLFPAPTADVDRYYMAACTLLCATQASETIRFDVVVCGACSVLASNG